VVSRRRSSTFNDIGEQSDKVMRFSGNLRLASESKPYRLLTELRRGDGGLVFGMAGYAGDHPGRMFDFRAEFARTDKPGCAPDAVS
jgi:hypothetical protein